MNVNEDVNPSGTTYLYIKRNTAFHLGLAPPRQTDQSSNTSYALVNNCVGRETNVFKIMSPILFFIQRIMHLKKKNQPAKWRIG